MIDSLRGDGAARHGFVEAVDCLIGLVKTEEFVRFPREWLALPFALMSFALGNARNMRLGFANALAYQPDCGLSMLIRGPVFSSAMQRVRANQGVAHVVTDDFGPALQEAVREPKSQPVVRHNLAVRAIEIGMLEFSANTAEQNSTKAISGCLLPIG